MQNDVIKKIFGDNILVEHFIPNDRQILDGYKECDAYCFYDGTFKIILGSSILPIEYNVKTISEYLRDEFIQADYCDEV